MAAAPKYDEAVLSVLWVPFGATGAVAIPTIARTPVVVNQGNR